MSAIGGCGTSTHTPPADAGTDAHARDAGAPCGSGCDASLLDAADAADAAGADASGPLPTCAELLASSSRCEREFSDCEWHVDRSRISGCDIRPYIACMVRRGCDSFACQEPYIDWVECFEDYCTAEDFPPECMTP